MTTEKGVPLGYQVTLHLPSLVTHRISFLDFWRWVIDPTAIKSSDVIYMAVIQRESGIRRSIAVKGNDDSRK